MYKSEDWARIRDEEANVKASHDRGGPDLDIRPDETPTQWIRRVRRAARGK